MRYTLFFILVLLCIIELNAQNHHLSGSPIKKSDKSRKSTTPEHKEETGTKTHEKKDQKDKDKGKNDTIPKKTEKQKQKDVIDWVLSKKGSGYAFGSSGQRLTKKLYEELRRKFGSNFKNSTKKWLFKEVYDCSGLVMKALEKIGVKLPHGATSAWKNGDWKEKGDIKHMPSNQVCVLYRRGSDGMVHSGIYLGNGNVIEAKGSAYGVVETSLKDGHWTDYAIPKGL
jgi:cell wall-associated NlpC family hydrolase